MNLLRNCTKPLLLAFLAAQGGGAIAAPGPLLPVKPDDTAVLQAQTDKPVDCKKTPKDPSCKEKKK